MMKQTLFLLFLALNVSCADAQSTASSTPSGYKAANEGWLVSLDEAYALSKKTGKPIMANFTGSDWCGWCKRLTASVFSKPEFKKWADQHVILLELDLPKRFQIPSEIREQNNNLQQAFKVTGYPTIWVFHMDKDKAGKYSINALGKTGYTATVPEFTSGVEQMIAQGKKG